MERTAKQPKREITVPRELARKEVTPNRAVFSAFVTLRPLIQVLLVWRPPTVRILLLL